MAQRAPAVWDFRWDHGSGRGPCGGVLAILLIGCFLFGNHVVKCLFYHLPTGGGSCPAPFLPISRLSPQCSWLFFPYCRFCIPMLPCAASPFFSFVAQVGAWSFLSQNH